MQFRGARGAIACVAIIVGACGDDGEGTASGAGGDQPCGIQACDAGSGGSGTGGGTGEGGTAACGLEAVANDELCADGAAELDCTTVADGVTHVMCGVGLGDPADDSGADDGCFAPGGQPAPPGAVGTTRLEGAVRIVGSACESSNVTIEVFTVEADGQLGARIGLSATTPATCETGDASPADGCPDGTRHACRFVYPSVPTETLLAIKTSGPTWAPVVDYGVFVTNDAAASGAFAYDARAVAVGDYEVFSQAAQGSPVPSTKGSLLGEVRDCAGAPVGGAVVGTDPRAATTSYFTDGPSPLPDASATATSADGVFAAFELPPGPARIVAAGGESGEAIGLGFRDVRILPDTITWVTLHGPLPTQVSGD